MELCSQLQNDDVELHPAALTDGSNSGEGEREERGDRAGATGEEAGEEERGQPTRAATQ